MVFKPKKPRKSFPCLHTKKTSINLKKFKEQFKADTSQNS